MKIIVTGAAGMLAAEVIPILLEKGDDVVQTDINQRLPVISALDVSNLEDVLRLAAEIRPDYIFHLGAETNVDLCQQDSEHAFKVNALGTKNVVAACKKFNSKLVYISTGAVFNGQKQAPYVEADDPEPVNIYGQSKLEGEAAIREELSEYFIFRAGWMVGGWELDKKFVYKIIQQLKEGKRKLMAVNDKFGSPTFTKDFARGLNVVVSSGRYGLYHMTNQGTCSRYDMAVKIAEFMGVGQEVNIEPVGSDRFPLPAPRSRSEMMENFKLASLGINMMPRWEDSLREYININKDK